MYSEGWKEGALPSYACLDMARAERRRLADLNGSLKGRAAWMSLPAVAMAATLGVSLPPAQAATTITGNSYVLLSSYAGVSDFLNAAGHTITPGSHLYAVFGDNSQPTWTLNNAGTISGNTSFNGGKGIYLKTAGIITNSGTIQATGQSGYGILLASGSVTNTSTGRIVGGPGSNTYGIKFTGGAGTVVNDGYIHAGYVALQLRAASSISNTGTIKGGSFGIRGFGDGMSINNSGYIGLSSQTGIYLQTNNTTITNSGTIAGFNSIIDLRGGNNLLQLLPGSTFIGGGGGGNQITGRYVSYNNSVEFAVGNGTTGTASLSQIQGFKTITVDSGATWVLNATGTGTIADTNATFTNNGTLTLNGTFVDKGTVNGTAGILLPFGSGSDKLILNGDSVQLAGLTADGGTGANTLAFYRYPGTPWTSGLSGNASFTNFQNFEITNTSRWTFNGNNSITSGNTLTIDSGGTFINGGTLTAVGGYIHNSGVLSGTGPTLSNGATLTNSGSISGQIVGTGTGSTLINSGNLANAGTAVALGSGDDTVQINTGAVFGGTVDAGGGTDLLEFVTGNGGTLSNTFLNFETAQVDSGASWVLSGSNTFNNITMTAGTLSNQGTLKSNVAFNADGTVINSGTIIGASGTAIQFGTGNDVLQIKTGAVFTGSVDGGAGTDLLEFVTGNGATLTNAITNFETAQVDAGANWALSGTRSFGSLNVASTGTLKNAGVLTAGTINNAGVFNAGNSFTLTAGGTNSGTLSGYTHFYGTGTLVNQSGGTITGGSTRGVRASGSISISNAGLIEGSYQAVIFLTGNAKVTNTGVIRATNAASNSTGVFIINGGTVLNNGGTISGAYAGVSADNAASSINNTGTIQQTGAYANSGAVIFYRNRNVNDTLTNSGAIIGNGGTAVAMGGGNDLLQVLTGASFTGVIDGGAGTDTIEFVTGNGATLGNSIINFESLTVDASASWVLSGDNSFTNAVIAATGTLGNTGTLTAAFSNAGLLNNSGSIVGTVSLTGSGSLANSGAISGAYGVIGGAGSPNVAITNTGTITGTAGAGIYLKAGGTFTNGDVSHTGATIGGTTYGILSAAAVANITNLGTITSAGTGIKFTDTIGTFNNTVLNDGAIIGNGGTAIAFAGGDDLLQINTGAIFTGSIDGGAGTDTIEFLTGNGGTLGNSISNFETAKVDAGASWVLSGSNSFTTVTIAAAGTLTNTGTLTATTVNNAGLLDNSGSIFGTVNLTNASASLLNEAGAAIASSVSGAAGVSAVAGVVINNYGSITGAVGNAAGVVLAGNNAFTNKVGANVLGQRYGIEVTGSGTTISNAGTIATSQSGSNALWPAAGFEDTEIMVFDRSGGVGWRDVGIRASTS